MADESSFIREALKLVGTGIVSFAAGWFLPILRERHGQVKLRNALYQELANNYTALRVNSEKANDFDWLRNNLQHEFAFHAYKKAAGNPDAFYRIPEHGWIERSFKELEKCTSLPVDDDQLIKQITRALGTIENIAPPADERLFDSMVPRKYRFQPATYN